MSDLKSNEMSASLTVGEAYAAMYTFLDDVYRRTQSDYLGVLLGGMSLLEDGSTADPAAWTDWEAAIERVREGKCNIELRLR